MFGKTLGQEARKRLSIATSEKRWYTDGKNNIYIHFSDAPPIGFRPGRTIKRRTKQQILDDKMKDDIK